jgi:hypothetical protein
MGDDTGERRALQRDKAALAAELADERRQALLSRISSLESYRDDHESRIDTLELWRASLDAERRAQRRMAPRPQDQPTDIVAAPAQHTPLSPLQQWSANAGGGGIVAGILFAFGKLMGWW